MSNAEETTVGDSAATLCSRAFDPWKFACDWYKVDEIEHHIARVNNPGLMQPADKAIPTNVQSREFAEWLTHQYRLAMQKGIQIGKSKDYRKWCS